MPNIDAHLYGRWVLANGWAEALGLGTTLLLGRAAAPLFERTTGVAATLLVAAVAVVLGIVLEGTVVGAAQARVLRRALAGFPPRDWIAATMLGAGIAWALGMVPSTIAVLSAGPEPQGPSAEPPTLLRYGLALGLGTVTGPILGAAQWRVLRRYVRDAHWWLWANAGAWALGMSLIFVGMDVVPWGRGSVAVAASVYAVCAVAGLGVGVVHGRVLLRLLQSPVAR